MHALMEKSSGDFPGLNSLRHHWTLESVGDEVWAKQISAIDSDSTRVVVENIVNKFRQYLSSSKNLPRIEFFLFYCSRVYAVSMDILIENFVKWSRSL